MSFAYYEYVFSCWCVIIGTVFLAAPLILMLIACCVSLISDIIIVYRAEEIEWIGGSLMKEGKIKVLWDGKKKNKFTIHYFVWNTKKDKAVNTDEAKKLVSQYIKKRYDKISAEYDVIYARSTGKKRINFLICPKPLANSILVFPKRYRQDARIKISEANILI